MKTIRHFALSMAIGMLTLSAFGQDAPAPEQPAEPQGPPPAASPPAASPPAQAPPVGAGAPAPSAPQAPRRVSRDDEFIPSEELSADEEVTYPVDI